MTHRLSSAYKNRRAQQECEKAAEELQVARRKQDAARVQNISDLQPPPRRGAEKLLEIGGLQLQNEYLKKHFVQTYKSGCSMK